MEAKILELRRNRKKFLVFSLLVRQDFPEKIGSDREKVEKFLPPTHAVLRSNVGRPLSALERGIAERLGAFLLFQSLKEKLKSRFFGNFGKVSSFEEI